VAQNQENNRRGEAMASLVLPSLVLLLLRCLIACRGERRKGKDQSRMTTTPWSESRISGIQIFSVKIKMMVVSVEEQESNRL
jgi:hypothetical protein